MLIIALWRRAGLEAVVAQYEPAQPAAINLVMLKKCTDARVGFGDRYRAGEAVPRLNAGSLRQLRFSTILAALKRFSERLSASGRVTTLEMGMLLSSWSNVATKSMSARRVDATDRAG